MKKRVKFHPIGPQIMLISMLSLALTVLVIVTVSLLNFRSYSNGIVVERAKVGMSVLQDNLSHELSVLPEQCAAWLADGAVTEAFAVRDAAALARTWEVSVSGGKRFCRVCDENGVTVFESADCPRIALNMTEIAHGKTAHGIVTAGESLLALYAAPFTAGDASGAVAVGFGMEDSAWMEKVKGLVNCEVTIFRDNIRLATTIRNPDTGKPVVGTPMADNIRAAVLGSGKSYVGQAVIFDVPYFVSYTPLLDVDGNICGAYFSGSNAIEVNRELTRVIVISVILSLAALATTALVLFFFVRKRVVAPIQEVSLLADEMERGNLSGPDSAFPFSRNEIGAFARKLQATKTQLNAYIHDISSVLSAMGEGDFTRRPSVEYVGDFVKIRDAFSEISRRLARTLGKMDVSAEGVRTGSGQIASASQTLASGSARQATAIEGINATVADINAQISATARNAGRASELSDACLKKTLEQDKKIREMLSAMDEIQRKSEEIRSVIKAIEDIAFQTSILSLNASVEASRAGETGKGFGVVAEEVRNLAAKSSQSAAATGQLISDTVRAVQRGAELARDVGGMMREVIEQTRQTNGIIEDINAAASVQAQAVAQVSSGISDVSGVIAQNSATAEQTAASCRELAAQSVTLKEQVDMFRV